MKKLTIISSIVVVGLLVSGLMFVENINQLVKSGVEKYGPEILQAPVTLSNIDISFLTGSGEFTDLTIGNPKGYKTDHALYMKRLKVVLDITSLTSDTIHIKTILIDSPEIVFEKGFKKSNLKQLEHNALTFMNSGPSQGNKQSKAKSKKVIIDRVIIQNANVSLSTNFLYGKTLSIPIPSIELTEIGKDQETSIANAVVTLLHAINSSALPIANSSGAKLKAHIIKPVKGIQKGVVATGKGLEKGMDKTGESLLKGGKKLKRLFKKGE